MSIVLASNTDNVLLLQNGEHVDVTTGLQPDGRAVTGLSVDEAKALRANSYVFTSTVMGYIKNRYGDDQSMLITDATVIRASDYINSFSERFRGYRSSDPQTSTLEWPRYYVYVGYHYIDPTVVPQAIKDAQCEAAYELAQGNDPQETADVTAGAVIQRERLDVLEIQYDTSRTTGDSSTLKLKRVLALLRPYLMNTLRVTR